MQWVFHPARMCTYPKGVKAAHRCDGPGVSVEYEPVRLAYVFSFMVGKDGPEIGSRTISTLRLEAVKN